MVVLQPQQHMSLHIQDLHSFVSVSELNYLKLSYKAQLFHMNRMYHVLDTVRELRAIMMDLLRPRIEELVDKVKLTKLESNLPHKERLKSNDGHYRHSTASTY